MAEWEVRRLSRDRRASPMIGLGRINIQSPETQSRCNGLAPKGHSSASMNGVLVTCLS